MITREFEGRTVRINRISGNVAFVDFQNGDGWEIGFVIDPHPFQFSEVELNVLNEVNQNTTINEQ